VFNFAGKTLVAASQKEAVLRILDAHNLGGANHMTPLWQSSKLGNDEKTGTDPGRGVWGAIATTEINGRRFLYLPLSGHPSKDSPAFPMTNGPREDGSVIAFEVVNEGGKISAKPLWTSANMVMPDNRMAVAVLTNQEASSAAGTIAMAVWGILGQPKTSDGNSPAESQVAAILNGLEDGQLDRSALTEDCSYYFSKQTVDDFASSLKPLGQVVEIKQTREMLRGGMTMRAFAVSFKSKRVNVSTYTMADGKLEQFLVEAIQ